VHYVIKVHCAPYPSIRERIAIGDLLPLGSLATLATLATWFRSFSSGKNIFSVIWAIPLPGALPAPSCYNNSALVVMDRKNPGLWW
jgi:hypothetical protein